VSKIIRLEIQIHEDLEAPEFARWVAHEGDYDLEVPTGTGETPEEAVLELIPLLKKLTLPTYVVLKMPHPWSPGWGVWKHPDKRFANDTPFPTQAEAAFFATACRTADGAF